VNNNLDKVRLDKLLLEARTRGFSRAGAGTHPRRQRFGRNQKISKAGTLVSSSATVRLLNEDLKYVSRGGLKLEGALDHWRIDVTGSMCLDIGTSTGGFMDCLLQARCRSRHRGRYRPWASRLQVAPDSRVQLLEKTNARYLTREQLSGQPIDFIAVDVSFISATLVLPAVVSAAFPDIAADRAGRKLIVLVKPQFEAGARMLAKVASSEIPASIGKSSKKFAIASCNLAPWQPT
jgi:23S rRNA (cytidine1920-2'-O)/16S rRNA (cytidine1409-2'-O)-methyltransferase